MPALIEFAKFLLRRHVTYLPLALGKLLDGTLSSSFSLSIVTNPASVRVPDFPELILLLIREADIPTNYSCANNVMIKSSFLNSVKVFLNWQRSVGLFFN